MSTDTPKATGRRRVHAVGRVGPGAPDGTPPAWLDDYAMVTRLDAGGYLGLTPAPKDPRP